MGDDVDRWHHWYALWPVRVVPLTWRWLTWIERRVTREAPNVTTVEYRVAARLSSAATQAVLVRGEEEKVNLGTALGQPNVEEGAAARSAG